MKTVIKGLMIFIILFAYSKSHSQNISEYYGSFSGKFDVSPGFQSSINQLKIKISPPGLIEITFHYKEEYKGALSANEFARSVEYQGTLSGKFDKSLQYTASGNVERVFGHIKGGKLIITDNSPFVGTSSGGIYFGELVATIDKVSSYSVSLANSKVSEECDFNIIVPEEVKPGSDFYVIIEQKGCLSSHPVIWYNGSDKPIPHWDGKSVKVQVQAVCCDTRAIEKTIIVPDYGSGKPITVTTQDPGALSIPPPDQLITGSAVSLLLLTLLQTLLGGGGSNTVPPVPTDDTTPKEPTPKDSLPKEPTPKEPLPKDPLPKDPPPKDPLTKDPLPKDPLPKDPLPKDPLPKDPIPKDPLPKDPLPKDPLPKDPIPKGPTPQEKAEKMKLLEDRQNKLRNLANEENVSITSKLTFVKNMFQTVPASIIEVKDTAVSAANTTVTVVKTTGQFAKELYQNPKERQKLNLNLINTMEHFKSNLGNYFESGKWNEDLNKIHEMNNKFVNDMWNNPVDTSKKFLTTAFGGHFYSNAINPDKPLGERLLNLGVGYIKTICTIGTIESGGIGTLLWDHHVNLISQKLSPYIPGFLDDVKDNAIIEGIKVKANNFYYTKIDPKPVNTTMVHNLNNFLENTVNPGYDNTIR